MAGIQYYKDLGVVRFVLFICLPLLVFGLGCTWEEHIAASKESKTFTCLDIDGTTLTFEWCIHCDGYEDCPGGEDEKNCSNNHGFAEPLVENHNKNAFLKPVLIVTVLVVILSLIGVVTLVSITRHRYHKKDQDDVYSNDQFFLSQPMSKDNATAQMFKTQDDLPI